MGLVVTAGCDGGGDYEGAERAPVSGTVTLDGNPVPWGTINFQPESQSGRMSFAPIEDGAYSIPEERGPNLGQYKVRIDGYAEKPAGAAEEEETEVEEEDAEDGDEVSAGPNIVPAKYNLQTTLQVEIVSGENTHDFPLTSN
jgi:hypothetical protein